MMLTLREILCALVRRASIRIFTRNVIYQDELVRACKTGKRIKKDYKLLHLSCAVN